MHSCSHLVIARALTAFSLFTSAALAQEIEPLINRSMTLPRGALDLTLQGTYTNLASGATPGSDVPGTFTGATLAFAVDYGVGDQVQLGLAVALPIDPAVSFGSVLASTAFALNPDAALRLDVGYERIGGIGEGATPIRSDRWFGAVGAPIKVPFSPSVAFVTGRVGAVHFGHFDVIGARPTGIYLGATLAPEAASDFFVFSAGNNNSRTAIGINLPLGLLLQPDPHFAFTLYTGYSAVITFPLSGSTESMSVLHFVPVGIEAVVTAARALDIGMRFFFDGYVAESRSGGGFAAALGSNYFDLRALMLWFRLRAG
jgi:hypothetical protein